jgi:hypothetical protein
MEKYRICQMSAAIYRQQKVLSHFPVCCWIDWLLMIKNCLIESGPLPSIDNKRYFPIFPCVVRLIGYDQKLPNWVWPTAIYRQQKVLYHFPVCCWIDWLLMIKNCLIESGSPCRLKGDRHPPRHLSTTKRTFPFSLVFFDWLVINDQKLPNWVWPTLYSCSTHYEQGH